MPRILILCPTHDHADTLFCSIASVRAQTVSDWELVVIGDGAPPRTAEVMRAITSDEPRVSYLEKEKGERYGEAYRDPVIRASDAEIVCHLSDDDIWSATHLEEMSALLERADWGAQAELRMAAHGRCLWMPYNHGPKGNRFRRVLTSGLNYVAYRRSAYLSLPEGWTPAPEDFGSDRFMWQKFLRAKPKLNVASTAASTVLKLPSRKERARLSPEERVAELAPWLARVNAPRQMIRLRRTASVASRILALMRRFDGHLESNWEDALANCGLRPVEVDASCTIAVNDDPMDLPLSPRQRREAEAVHAITRDLYGKTNGHVDQSDLRNVLGDERWLWLTMLRAFGPVDPEATACIEQGFVQHFDVPPDTIGRSD